MSKVSVQFQKLLESKISTIEASWIKKLTSEVSEYQLVPKSLHQIFPEKILKFQLTPKQKVKSDTEAFDCRVYLETEDQLRCVIDVAFDWIDIYLYEDSEAGFILFTEHNEDKFYFNIETDE